MAFNTDEDGNEFVSIAESIKYPFYGVQFHPESIASQYGYQLINNFFDKTGIKI